MPEQPSGTVTFLFTDLERSTRLWHDYPAAMPGAYVRHDTLLRTAIANHGGITYKVVGDAVQAAFPTAPAALAAALQAQQALRAEPWERCGVPEPLRVRMALHAGAVDPDAEGDYRSPVLNRLGRLLAAGHGGQVLISAAVQELVCENLPATASLRDLGAHRLKDLERPSPIFQLLHPELEERFSPLRTLEHHPHNLPLLLTAFLGREREVAEVVALLRRDDVRLLTLTGPGGTGKTRLSLQVAGELVEEFRDGVWLVELASITDPNLVPSAIAEALHVREEGGRPLRETLLEFLHGKQALLVLDNCEHLLTAAPVVGEVLGAAPAVKVMATSRAPLRLQGEREVAVRPLGLPDLRHLEGVESLTQYEAVRLFIARAQDVKADFAVDNANAPAVAEICVRLDGLPLAIELAAARSKLLPPEILLRRLGQRLPLLTGGARDAPERQRTLRAAIAWSHDLLTPAERTFFQRLAVFAGGFGLEAAEAVADLGGEMYVFEGLAALVDHSLLKSDQHDGEPRFAMLETIREFALEALQAVKEEHAVSLCHAGIYRDLAERAEPALLGGSDEARWLRVLDIEHDNVRSALGWSLLHSPPTAVRLAGALTRFWMARGHLSEGGQWLERANAIASTEDPRWSAKALHGAGRIAWVQGDYVRSVSLHEQSLTLWRMSDERVEIAWAETALADAAAEAGDEARAIGLYQDALQLFRAMSEPQGVSIVLNNLGVRAQRGGEWDRAAALYDEALAIDRRLGDTTGIIVALGNLGDIALERGRIDEAAARFRESLGLAWESEDAIMSLQGLVGLGRVAVESGRFAHGARLLAAAEAHSEAIEAPLQPGERVGFAAAAAKAMTALGAVEGERAWSAGRAAEFRVVVLEEISSDQDCP